MVRNLIKATYWSIRLQLIIYQAPLASYFSFSRFSRPSLFSSIDRSITHTREVIIMVTLHHPVCCQLLLLASENKGADTAMARDHGTGRGRSAVSFVSRWRIVSRVGVRFIRRLTCPRPRICLLHLYRRVRANKLYLKDWEVVRVAFIPNQI